jgi:acyl-CoA synthetase (NDP forming)
MSKPTVEETLDRVFAPRSIAVLGASHTKGKLGHSVIALLKQNGYEGRIIPVNPKGGTIVGLDCARSMSDIDYTVDVALLVVPAESSLEAMRECAAAKVGSVVAITSGFAESGDEAGQSNEAALRDFLKIAPYRMIGPNCEGVVSTQSKLQMTFSPMFNDMKPGGLALISQSGALSGMMANRLTRRGIGFRAVVTTGNEVDITATDLLDWFANDAEVKVILAYLEQVRDPRRFVEVARRLRSIGKSLVILKGGRSQAGGEAAASHTGALAGDDKVVTGVFRELGIVRVRDSAAAVDAVSALSMGKRLSGPRIAVVSIAGGFGVEMTDLAQTSGFDVPPLSDTAQTRLRSLLPFYGATRNPVDLTGTAVTKSSIMRDAIDVVLSEDNIDALVVIVTFSHDPAFAEAIIHAHRSSDKPVLVCWTGGTDQNPGATALLRDEGIPTFDAPARVLTALQALRNEGLVA